MEYVRIYTDGSASPNPGRGGWAAIVAGLPGGERVLSGGYALTTNNRMEILAAVLALENLPEPSAVEIVTDSRYLIDGSRWARGWQVRHWRLSERNGSKRAKNVDLWARLIAECDRHTVRWTWTRGHAGHAQNERCDGLAAQAARHATGTDDGYLGGQEI